MQKKLAQPPMPQAGYRPQVPNDQYSEQLQALYNHQLQNLMQQHQAAMNNFEYTHKTMENSPSKNDSKMAGKKKIQKVLRKSVRTKEQPQDAASKAAMAKSVDRVSSLKQVPQNQIQINVDSNQKQVQESKMFANNIIKFQSTSTKSNGAKKIRVTGQDIQQSNDAVYQHLKAQVSNNVSYLQMDKLEHPSNQMYIQQSDATQMTSLNQSLFLGHKKNILSSNYGSGTNLNNPQKSNLGGTQQIPLFNNFVTAGNSQQRRKPSIQTGKKLLLSNDAHQPPCINSNINTDLLMSGGNPGLINHQSKTTKNQNVQQIEAGLGLQVKASVQAKQATALKLKSQKTSQNKQQEFNCLINNNTANFNQEDARIASAVNPRPKHLSLLSQNLEVQHIQQAHTLNHSQFRMRQDFTSSNMQKSQENLHQDNSEILQFQNQEYMNPFSNSQGLNIQQIMLETDETFRSETKNNKQPANSSKRINTNGQQDLMKHFETNKGNLMSLNPKNLLGPYIIQNNNQLAQQVVQGIPNMKYYNHQMGSSSATNKAKKAFNFEIDPNQKVKGPKSQGQSAVVFGSKQRQLPTTKAQASQIQAGTQQPKKIVMQNKQKLKTQMNLTGPIPKHILSPKTVANKSQGKSKHSQYFNNEQEIVMQNQFMMPQKMGGFGLSQMTPHNNNGDLQIFYQNQNMVPNQINQHQHQQYQVNLNGVPSGHTHQLQETNSPRTNQPQITTSTQGCNTVININIDSNTFRRLHNDTHSKTESNPQAVLQKQNSANQKSSNKTRQTSSKMKRNDSISSNKSKRVGQNRRSNSGSQMRQQQLAAFQVNQLNGLNQSFNPQQVFMKNSQSSPKSNTDIIMNNIAMINQKLSQQEAVNYQGNGNLQININRVNDGANNNFSTLKKNSKSKQKAKEAQVLDPKPASHNMFGINPNLFNQTQKLVGTNHQQIEQPMLYSIIPKKQVQPQQQQVIDSESTFVGSNYKMNQNQKLTIKKITRPKKSENTNSIIDSARTPSKSTNTQTQQQQVQSYFYGNQGGKQDEMINELMNIENVIHQNQIKLRNELLQMQNSLKKKDKHQSNTRSQLRQQDMDDSDTFQHYDELEEQQISKNYSFAPQINMLQQNMAVEGRPKHDRDFQTQAIQKGQPTRPPVQHQPKSLPQQPKPNRSTGNSVQGRIQNPHPKMNIEDINIEIEQLNQLPHTHADKALNYISTKKSVSTKNQFNQNKIQTQNVQNLLREAKREMVDHSHDRSDMILVGSDDLSTDGGRKKLGGGGGGRFNFNEVKNTFNHNLQISSQPINFQMIPMPKGFTPQNNNGQICDFDIRDFHSQGTMGSSSTFGLSQINKKKQIIINQQDYNNQSQQKNKQQNQARQGQKKELPVSIAKQKKPMLKESVTAPFQQQQMKQSVQFPKKNVEASHAAQATEYNEMFPNGHSSMTGTIPSQISDYNTHKVDNRNSNLPPHSNVQMYSDAENLIIDSRISEIEEQEIMTNPPSALLVQQESSSQPSMPVKKEDEDGLTLPISGAKVLKYFLKRQGLTEYEKSEVLDYKQVFFLGLEAEKIQGSKTNPFNFGYDDERGDYNVVLKDQIAFRFEVIDFLGKGSFGQALKCFDHKTQEIVAIKIIRNKKKFQHQAGVELKILLHLRDNDPDDTNNIIRIKDYCHFRKHLIISFELFSINLYEFIKNNNFEGVSLSLIRRFAIQILQALKYLRDEDLIHCDLKPENILLKSPDKSGIKVIDFGSSCFSNERIYTYIQSRFYRAPEIILGIPYTSAIDMWSFGCILAELFTGIPIFPGESEQEQLSMIIQVLGLPDEETLENASRKKIFFDEETNEPVLTRDSQGEMRAPLTRPLEQVLMCQSETFVDFIKQCLEWNPERRISPFDALMHEWIIEGLPPQVLVHHKKMLGIHDSNMNESESMMDENQMRPMTSNSNFQANESIIHDSQNGEPLDTSQFDPNCEPQNLSCSIMQVFDDIEIQHNKNQFIF